MKTLFSLLLFSMIGLAAQAHTIYGSECGLIDAADDFTVQGSHWDLDKHSKLTSLQGRQVKATLEDSSQMTSKEALMALIESSESGDVSYETGLFQGKYYDVVRYYPGGNPYGAIFAKGSDRPIAFIQDSDLVCAE